MLAWLSKKDYNIFTDPTTQQETTWTSTHTLIQTIKILLQLRLENDLVTLEKVYATLRNVDLVMMGGTVRLRPMCLLVLKWVLPSYINIFMVLKFNMDKLFLFIIGFLGAYVLTLFSIQSVGLHYTSIIVFITFLIMYNIVSWYKSVINKTDKEVATKELDIWLDHVEQDYKRNDNIDRQLVNPIYSHTKDQLFTQRDKYLNNSLRKLMFKKLY